MTSPHDYPMDEELCLRDPRPEPVYRLVTARCGCEVEPSTIHDVDRCLEEQADALAFAEEQIAQGDPRGYFP